MKTDTDHFCDLCTCDLPAGPHRVEIIPPERVLVMNGVDLLTVKELMGHRSLKMTQRYAHLSPTHRTRAVSVLDEVLPNSCPSGATNRDQSEPDETK